MTIKPFEQIAYIPNGIWSCWHNLPQYAANGGYGQKILDAVEAGATGIIGFDEWSRNPDFSDPRKIAEAHRLLNLCDSLGIKVWIEGHNMSKCDLENPTGFYIEKPEQYGLAIPPPPVMNFALSKDPGLRDYRDISIPADLNGHFKISFTVTGGFWSVTAARAWALGPPTLPQPACNPLPRLSSPLTKAASALK
jgi:hypothetical protein